MDTFIFIGEQGVCQKSVFIYQLVEEIRREKRGKIDVYVNPLTVNGTS